MANLLSPELKNGIKKEYRLRLIAVVLFLLSLCVFSASVLLIPAYLNAQSELETLGYEIEAIKSAGTSVIDPATQIEAAAIGARINILSALNITGLEQYIEYNALLNALPTYLDYQMFSFKEKPKSEGDDNKGQQEERTTAILAVSGVADNRSELASAINDLQKIEWIEGVNYPLSDLGQAGNISFSLTITYRVNEVPAIIQYRNQLSTPEFKNIEVTGQVEGSFQQGDNTGSGVSESETGEPEAEESETELAPEDQIPASELSGNDNEL